MKGSLPYLLCLLIVLVSKQAFTHPNFTAEVAPITFYSYQAGNWNELTTWTTDGAATPLFINPGRLPQAGDRVVINNGRPVTVPATYNNITIDAIQVDGVLDLTNSSGHTFTDINGNGKIRLAGSASDGSGVLNFPSGDASDFADAALGGTTEVYGNGLTLDVNRSFRILILNLTGVDKEVRLGANLTINAEIYLNKGTLVFGDGTTTSRTVNAYGDVFVRAGGLYDARIRVAATDARHQFNLYKGLFNNGGDIAFTNRTTPNFSNEANDGIVDVNFLNNTSDQQLVCNGPSRFYRIEIDKGTDQTYQVSLTADQPGRFSLLGPANQNHGYTAQLSNNSNALGLIRGTVRIGENIIIPSLNRSGNYNISENARLWVDGGSVHKDGGEAVVLYGTLLITNGSLNANVRSGITFRENGTIRVEGGELNTYAIRNTVDGTGNNGGYIQTGGVTNVTGVNTYSNYYTFNLSYPDNVFRMSGGTLHVHRAKDGYGLLINSNPENLNVSGGQVILETNNAGDFAITSTAPFYDLELRNSSGSTTKFQLKGDGGRVPDIDPIEASSLKVLRNLTLTNNAVLDHEGEDLFIGKNFTINDGAEYIFDAAKQNTTYFNGAEDAVFNLQNRKGNSSSDEQLLWNMVIDKPAGKTLKLQANAAKKVNGNDSNLLYIQGGFSLLSGIFDHDIYSVRFYGDVTNYGVLGLYAPGVSSKDALLKFRPEDFTIETSEGAEFGNMRLNNSNKVLSLSSDIYVKRIEYRHGRLNLGGYRLTLDELDINLNNGETNGGMLSVEDMFITSGKGSDGGLRLKVTGNGTYNFPLGIGTTNNASTSKYTPAQLTVSNFSGAGYIQLSLEDSQLLTTDMSGGNLLDYYWRVRYDGFSTLPTVRWTFNYNNRDTHTGNQLTTADNYVAGKVLDINPFTRSHEGVVINGTNQLLFDGTGSGFTLETASYTAGQSNRFVGAPKVFYTTNRANGDWNQENNWRTDDAANGDEAGDTGYPGTGDIAIIRSFDGSAKGWVNQNQNSIQLAKLIFQKAADGWRPRVTITNRTSVNNFGQVSGEGTINVEHTVTQQPSFGTSDFGDFVREENAFFLFKADGNSTTPIPLPSIPAYPNLRIEGGDGNFGQRMTATSQPITVNKNLWADYGGEFVVAHDVRIKGNLLPGRGGGKRGGITLWDDREVLLQVDGKFDMDSSNVESRIIVANAKQNSYQHRVLVGGDIQFGGKNSSVFDLYNGAGANNNAVLEFIGSGESRFVRSNGNTPDLYRLVVNKEDKEDKIRITTDFLLNGATNTADKAINLQQGILELDNANHDFTLSSGGGNFLIPAAAGLVLKQGSLRVEGDNTGILLDGLLEIDGGNLNMNTGTGNGNNFIEYSASGKAQLAVKAGTLTVGSQIRRSNLTDDGILHYAQTGGTVVVGAALNAPVLQNRAMLEVLNEGSFTYTGGSLTIVRQNGAAPTIAALYLNPESSSVGNTTVFMGNSNTPAGQTNFGIESGIRLHNVALAGNNNPVHQLRTQPLYLNGSLQINANNTFRANGFTVSLEGNLENNGVYSADGNTTHFLAPSANQQITGSGTNTLFTLSKSGSGSLGLTNNINVAGNLNLFEGILTDNGNAITVNGQVLVDGTHTSTGGNGIIFSGSSQQFLKRTNPGESQLGIITINNASGVVVPDGSGFNFRISGGLRLQQGVLDIGGNLLTLTENAPITAVNAFGVTNMIQTNSSFTDNGVRKWFSPVSSATSFVFPVGQGKYTPLELTIDNSTAGSITIRPANEMHPSIIEDAEAPNIEITDREHALNYHWILTASGISNFSGSARFKFDLTDALLPAGSPYTLANYIPARLFESSVTWDKAFSEANFDETNGYLNFTFSNANVSSLAGDYTAGVGVDNADLPIKGAIPDQVPVYTTTSTGGSFNDPAAYTASSPAFGSEGPVGGILVVASGATLTMNANNSRLLRTEIKAGGTLDIANTLGHRLGIVYGTGTMRISSSTMPAGYYTDFFSCSGGGLEYTGSTDYDVLAGIPQIRRVSFTGTGNRRLPNTNLLVCTDLTVNGPVVTNDFSRQVTVQGNVNLQAGTLNMDVNSRLLVEQDFNQTGGAFIAGSGSVLELRRHLSRTNGSFNALGSEVLFNGSSAQVINGNFTGSNRFSTLSVNKSGGTLSLSLTGGNVEVAQQLNLTRGNVATYTNPFTLLSAAAISGGSINSYVDGALTKQALGSNQSFRFPVGKSGRFMPARVVEDGSGNVDWTVEYYSSNSLDPTAYDATDNGYGSLEVVSEYDRWEITGSGTATIGISYGSHNIITDNNSLVVAHWNTATSQWNNKGGNLQSGASASRGELMSETTTSFSTQSFTLASTTVQPLPVILKSFIAEQTTEGVLLKWTTSMEINNDYFEIEYSENGVDYQVIGQMSGNGNTSEEINYHYIHNRPLNGFNYYRLKQFDYDGKFETFGPVSVLVQGFTPRLETKILVNPNPVENKVVNLNVQGFRKEAPVSLLLLNNMGQNVFSQRVSTNEAGQVKQAINLPAYLPTGTYNLIVQDGINVRSLRILVL